MAQRAPIPSGASVARARNLESAADEYGSSRTGNEEFRAFGSMKFVLREFWANLEFATHTY
jgi:hypothetical protein